MTEINENQTSETSANETLLNQDALGQNQANATQNISFAREIYRKIFHLGILTFPALYYFLGKWHALMIIAPAAAVMFALDYSRRKNQKLEFYFAKFGGLILRKHELSGKNFCGATWALIAATLIFLCSKEEIAITAFAILAICDATAAIVGRLIVSDPFFEKSLAGSIAFYVSGLLVLFICGGIFDVKLWFYIFGFFALFATTVIEARPSLLHLDDNFTVPAMFALTMSMFDLMWGITA